MHFEVVHEFDIPLDALELAVISPNLFQELSKRLHSIESVSKGASLRPPEPASRAALEIRAKVKIRLPTRYGTPESERGREIKTTSSTHAQSGRSPAVSPVEEPLRRRGTTRWASWEAVGRVARVRPARLRGRVRRSQVAEKLIVGEVRKTFDAEAETLRELATLV